MRRLVLLAVVLLLVAGCSLLPAPTKAPPTPTTRPLVDDHPNPTLTPGQTLPGVTAAQVCTPGWASQHRHSLTPAEKRQVLAAYGDRAGQPVAEWDHLIPLELGGANGTRNIWPQLSKDDVARKDQLEGRLHALVCAGRLDLKAAQAEAREYWKHW